MWWIGRPPRYVLSSIHRAGDLIKPLVPLLQRAGHRPLSFVFQLINGLCSFIPTWFNTTNLFQGAGVGTLKRRKQGRESWDLVWYVHLSRLLLCQPVRLHHFHPLNVPEHRAGTRPVFRKDGEYLVLSERGEFIANSIMRNFDTKSPVLWLNTLTQHLGHGTVGTFGVSVRLRLICTRHTELLLQSRNEDAAKMYW
jgi:hypothetical protein